DHFRRNRRRAASYLLASDARSSSALPSKPSKGRPMNTTIRTSTLSIAVTLSLTACSSGPAGSTEPTASAAEPLTVTPGFDLPGAIFTQTNASDRNELVAYL